MGSNPIPSSTDCALAAAHMLAALLDMCRDRIPGIVINAPPTGIDLTRCALIDLGLFGAIGILRELSAMASSGECRGALAAAREVASYLAGRAELPDDVRRWASEVSTSASIST